MRWIFISLVLINAMILSWRFLAKPDEAVAPKMEVETVAESSSVSDLEAKTITLLDEVGRKKVELTPVDLAAIEPGIAGPEAISIREGEPTALLPGAAGAALVEQPEDVDACYWAGPFAEQDDRGALVARLMGLNVSAEERSQRASGGWRYWVYLPPKVSRDEAKSELAVLKNMNIESYLIYKGEKANGISLGLFSRKVLADAKYADIKKRGFGVVMDSYEREVTQRWITVNKREMDAVGEGVLPRMLKNKSDVQIIEKKCELPVASHADIH